MLEIGAAIRAKKGRCTLMRNSQGASGNIRFVPLQKNRVHFPSQIWSIGWTGM